MRRTAGAPVNAVFFEKGLRNTVYYYLLRTPPIGYFGNIDKHTSPARHCSWNRAGLRFRSRSQASPWGLAGGAYIEPDNDEGGLIRGK